MIGWIALVIALMVATFFLIGPQRVWHRTAGSPDLGPLTLNTLARTGKPNDALLALPDHVPLPPDGPVPVFAVPARVLFDQVIERIDSANTIDWVEQDEDTLYARALTFSPLMRFPDTNHIWVIELGPERSTLVLYSAAQLGHSDLGKNRARLESWLALVEDLPRTTP